MSPYPEGARHGTADDRGPLRRRLARTHEETGGGERDGVRGDTGDEVADVGRDGRG